MEKKRQTDFASFDQKELSEFVQCVTIDDAAYLFSVPLSLFDGIKIGKTGFRSFDLLPILSKASKKTQSSPPG